MWWNSSLSVDHQEVFSLMTAMTSSLPAAAAADGGAGCHSL